MRGFWARLVRLTVRIIIAGAVGWTMISAPLPWLDPNFVVSLRVPIAVFLLIVYSGKVLYDTFFYERQP